MKACDSHLHVYDARFAPAPGATVPSGLTLDDYLAVRGAYGTERAVLVQAKVFGIDNACLVEALQRLGADGRGIAVVDPAISDAELEALHTAGVRGLRFSLWNPSNAVARPDDIATMAARVAPFGWHLQLHMHADQTAASADLLMGLACPMVFDHMGRLPSGSTPQDHPAFDLIAGLARDGRAWVKLSGPYLNRREGAAGAGDTLAIARSWVGAIPDRLVWGSDWPHITEQPAPPAPASIAATLTDWCDGDAALIDHIARQTPARLYDFEP
ncbi:amidohydrolase family protein [Pseudooceanicola nanhaiensis]|uniref:amidohydrolase family protein n=1 Tax=Pseudooceanicola nanhaiensis TaxID=375761 RepID=UPI001CD64748|nr:amidohydrolase family protein [Pseudooceanicola nanhaiensis]MCA0920406.1 amidohydrolase family protein [Pseudooceanicola nanhaiensis]